MSAFSTLDDVFSDPEFAAAGRPLLWGLGGLDDTCRECTGFMIMLKRPYEWRLVLTAVTSSTTLTLASDPVIRLLTSQSSFSIAPPTSQAPTVSHAVPRLSNVAWSGLLVSMSANASENSLRCKLFGIL